MRLIMHLVVLFIKIEDCIKGMARVVRLNMIEFRDIYDWQRGPWDAMVNRNYTSFSLDLTNIKAIGKKAVLIIARGIKVLAVAWFDGVKIIARR